MRRCKHLCMGLILCLWRMSESALMREVRAVLSALGLRMFRNNVGALCDIHGTWVKYGLCAGSSDLIGWRTTTITADMVGKPVAIFTAVEVKMPGARLTNEQTVFKRRVREAGGISFISRDPATIEEQITDALQNLGEKHDTDRI